MVRSRWKEVSSSLRENELGLAVLRCPTGALHFVRHDGGAPDRSLIGNGDTPMVHHPNFIFGQGILPRGAAYWVALTEGYLR